MKVHYKELEATDNKVVEQLSKNIIDNKILWIPFDLLKAHKELQELNEKLRRHREKNANQEYIEKTIKEIDKRNFLIENIENSKFEDLYFNFVTDFIGNFKSQYYYGEHKAIVRFSIIVNDRLRYSWKMFQHSNHHVGIKYLLRKESAQYKGMDPEDKEKSFLYSFPSFINRNNVTLNIQEYIKNLNYAF